MDEDAVFKGLADPSRRRLLDLLFDRDGQTLGELCARIPGMTRFGVMKHLTVLEGAGLVSARKVGREKLHYLNPVPIQLAYDRWVGKYTQPWARALTGLKSAVERSMPVRPSHVFEIYIRATPEHVWQALVDGDVTRGYYFGCRVESAWTPGSRYRLVDAAGATLVAGENLEVDPPHRLVQTFDILGGPGRQRMGARVPRPSSGRSSGWAMWARRVS